MTGKVRTILALAAAATLIGGSVHTFAAEPTTKDLMEQIQQLQSKVQELEKKQDQQPQISRSADQDRAIADVLKDAQQRSQWLQNDTMMSNYQSGKFTLRDETGNFLLHPWFQFQPRYVTNFRENAPGGGDDTQGGFELRRMKFGFDGNAFTPNLTYLFNWATNRKTGNPDLEEAWVRYQLADEWAVQGGQIKDPLAHESMNSSKYFMAADRSYPVDLFTGGDNYVQGISLIYTAGPWHAYGAFTDGARNNFNQNFQDFPTNNANFGVAGRVEYKLMGDWGDYTKFNPIGLKRDLLVTGAGADYTQAGDTGFLLHTVDAQYMLTTGWSFYGAYLARAIQDGPVSSGAPAPAGFDGYDWSLEGQVGYLIDKWEPFVRYTYTNFDSAEFPAGAENVVHEITVGVNYFWHGESAKFTLDLTYLPNGAPQTDDGSGILVNSGDNEVLMRMQFQLLL